MKKFVTLSGGLALAMTVTQAMAGGAGATFHTFSQMAAGERAAFTAMTDGQLAAVEGGDIVINVTSGRHRISVVREDPRDVQVTIVNGDVVVIDNGQTVEVNNGLSYVARITQVGSGNNVVVVSQIGGPP